MGLFAHFLGGSARPDPSSYEIIVVDQLIRRSRSRSVVVGCSFLFISRFSPPLQFWVLRTRISEGKKMKNGFLSLFLSQYEKFATEQINYQWLKLPSPVRTTCAARQTCYLAVAVLRRVRWSPRPSILACRYGWRGNIISVIHTFLAHPQNK